MYSRIRRSRNNSGKWQHVPHTGVGNSSREQVGDWLIEVSHRRVGGAMKRDQYSVIIRREEPRYEESLAGFSNKSAALEAGRNRVELLQHVRQPVASPGPHLLRRRDATSAS